MEQDKSPIRSYSCRLQQGNQEAPRNQPPSTKPLPSLPRARSGSWSDVYLSCALLVDSGQVITLNAREDARIAGSGVMDAAVESVVASAENDPATAAILEDTRDLPDLRIVFGVAIVMGFVAVQFVIWMLKKLGFGKKGIKTNSVAAYWQASMQGAVPKESLFALLQSWGVKGLPLVVKFLIGYIFFYIALFSFL